MRKVIEALKILTSALATLIGEQRYSAGVKRISNIPMVRPFFYLVYYLLSAQMIVWQKGESSWLVWLPGRVKLLAPDSSDTVSHIIAIWRRGIYDKYRPGPGEVVFDVGAHIGIYTVKAAKEVGKNGIVVAIEPAPVNFKFLKENLKLNNCANAIPVSTALGSTCGQTTLFLSARSTSHSTILKSDRHILVPSTTLDQLMRTLKLTTLDLIKANVEGAMMHILEGGEETLSLYKPKIIAEAGHYPAEKADLVRFLSQRGFITVQTESTMIYAEPEC